MAATDRHSVTILGAGPIGAAFAATFIDAGLPVSLVEPDAARRHAVADAILSQRSAMSLAGLAQGGDGSLSVRDEVPDTVSECDLVLECGPERLEIKQAIFAELLQKAGPDAVIATTTSAIPLSRILPVPADQYRCIVAHPANPPSILRVVELVPAPGTSERTRDRAADLFAGLGFVPVLLGAEIEGFVMNRLQGAVLREAYRLVDEGIAGPADIDAVMRLSLGPRWALSGPFETADLNTPGGITAHAKRMGPAYRRMGEARGETVDWSPSLVARVEAERRRVLPEPEIPARVAWRTKAVARLIAARDRIGVDPDA